MGRSSEKGKELRELELLDYYHLVIENENVDYRKTKKKIIGGIKRKLFKDHTFRYILRHMGKGERDRIKRIHTDDNNNQIIKIL